MSLPPDGSQSADKAWTFIIQTQELHSTQSRYPNRHAENSPIQLRKPEKNASLIQFPVRPQKRTCHDMDSLFIFHKMEECVCVCVCVCERERERELFVRTCVKSSLWRVDEKEEFPSFVFYRRREKEGESERRPKREDERERDHSYTRGMRVCKCKREEWEIEAECVAAEKWDGRMFFQAPRAGGVR